MMAQGANTRTYDTDAQRAQVILATPSRANKRSTAPQSPPPLPPPPARLLKPREHPLPCSSPDAIPISQPLPPSPNAPSQPPKATSSSHRRVEPYVGERPVRLEPSHFPPSVSSLYEAHFCLFLHFLSDFRLGLSSLSPVVCAGKSSESWGPSSER